MELVMVVMITVILVSKLYFCSNQIEMDFFFLDSMGMSMSHLSILLSSLALSVYLKTNDKVKSILCIVSSMVAFIFFHCNNLLFFFILFEASLIPLVILILGWGKQPERILAGQYIMVYTLVSSFPFLCIVVWTDEIEGLFSMNNPSVQSNYNDFFFISPEFNLFISMSLFLAFMVKVPVFFLHSWLPKAHVEAPLEGSIILAGIMLKVGTFGIFRAVAILPSDFLDYFMTFFFCISLIGSVYSVMMAVSSDDLKLSIALSSISHMNFLLSSITPLKELTMGMATFTMISHGFSSSILFFFVTIIYEAKNSRSMVLVKGLVSKMPSLILFSFLFFCVSISIPPSLSFFGEMISVFSIWSFLVESVILVCMYIIFNSFYSMMNFSIICHSAKMKNFKPSPFETIFNVKSAFFLLILFFSFFFPESVM